MQLEPMRLLGPHYLLNGRHLSLAAYLVKTGYGDQFADDQEITGHFNFLPKTMFYEANAIAGQKLYIDPEEQMFSFGLIVHAFSGCKHKAISKAAFAKMSEYSPDWKIWLKVLAVDLVFEAPQFTTCLIGLSNR